MAIRMKTSANMNDLSGLAREAQGNSSLWFFAMDRLRTSTREQATELRQLRGISRFQGHAGLGH
jgi:hypothetical protein